MSQRGFVPIFMLVVILAVAVVGTLYFLKPQKTNNVPSSQPVVSQTPSVTQTFTQPTIKIDPNKGQYSRKVLRQTEYQKYLDIMGIKTISIPEIYGSPYLILEWNSDKDIPDGYRAVSGRMILLTFADTKVDEWQWGTEIDYATYDFSIGSEADIFAERKDYEAINKNQSQGNKIITVNNKKAYVKYEPIRSLDSTILINTIRKIVVFPFENYWLALTYSLKGDYANNWETVIQSLNSGNYPKTEEEGLKQFDSVVSSINFK